MNNEFSPEIITLIDDDNKEHVFEILDVIDNDEGCFYALLPKKENSDDILSDANYYIFEEINDEDEPVLAEVEDDDLLDRLAGEFESRFEELYEKNETNNGN